MALPIRTWNVVVAVGKPVALVLVGAVAQAAMLPFLGAAACLIRDREARAEVAPRSITDPLLWLAVLSTGAVSVHQVIAAFAS